MNKKGSYISGVEEIQKILRDAAEKEARNLSKSAVYNLAAKTRNEMKQKVSGYKDSGTLYKSIKVKRRKGTPTKPQTDVIIKTGKDGAWYWHMVESGSKTDNIQPHYFVRDTKKELEDSAAEWFVEAFEKVLVKKLKRALKQIKKGDK